MGIRGGKERANQVQADALTGVSNGVALEILGDFNWSVFGTFVGTAVLQKSFDGGTTWINATHPYTGNALSLTAPGTFVLMEPEPGVQYRTACTAFTSGTINGRLSAGMNLAARQDKCLT